MECNLCPNKIRKKERNYITFTPTNRLITNAEGNKVVHYKIMVCDTCFKYFYDKIIKMAKKDEG
jgi:hypothetical protein